MSHKNRQTYWLKSIGDVTLSINKKFWIYVYKFRKNRGSYAQFQFGSTYLNKCSEAANALFKDS
jgi:hypothetical protein